MDAARLDHFRGFVAYWAVPEGDHNARRGRWRRGPGRGPVRASPASWAGALPLVAEDLGVITPPVERLRDELGLPGMLVLQFGFDPAAPRSPHRFANHVEYRIVYTGTHDHDTARGWYESLSAQIRRRVDSEIAARGMHRARTLVGDSSGSRWPRRRGSPCSRPRTSSASAARRG